MRSHPERKMKPQDRAGRTLSGSNDLNVVVKNVSGVNFLGQTDLIARARQNEFTHHLTKARIFISIDDNEVYNLRQICNEIYGEENFVAEFVWIKKKKGSHLSETRRSMTEYVLCYARNIEQLALYGEPAYQDKQQPLVKRTNAVKSLVFPESIVITTLPDGKYEPGFHSSGTTAVEFLNAFTVADGKILEKLGVKGPFVWTQEYLDDTLSKGTTIFLSKKFGFNALKHDQSTKYKTPNTLLDLEQGVGTYEDASAELQKIFKIEKLMDYPKPTSLIRYICNTNTFFDREGIILDFFAGSGTTAQAVIELNQIDDGNRRFILVQLPEPTGRQDYPTIAEICKERIRRVIKELKAGKNGKLPLRGDKEEDLGFKVFKLMPSSFKIWDGEVSKDGTTKVAQQLEFHVDHVNPKSSQETVLYELLLKAGFELSEKIEKLTLGGKTVYSVTDGAMLISLEEKLTKEVINAMAEKQPSRVVCLDKGFKDNDQLKANAVQIMKSQKVNKFETV